MPPERNQAQANPLGTAPIKLCVIKANIAFLRGNAELLRKAFLKAAVYLGRFPKLDAILHLDDLQPVVFLYIQGFQEDIGQTDTLAVPPFLNRCVHTDHPTYSIYKVYTTVKDLYKRK